MLKDPSFYVFLSFIVFIACVGKKIFIAVRSLIDEKIDTISKQVNELNEQCNDAKSFLNDAKVKYNQSVMHSKEALSTSKEIAIHKEKEFKFLLEGLVEKKKEIAKARQKMLIDLSAREMREEIASSFVTLISGKLLKIENHEIAATMNIIEKK